MDKETKKVLDRVMPKHITTKQGIPGVISSWEQWMEEIKADKLES